MTGTRRRSLQSKALGVAALLLWLAGCNGDRNPSVDEVLDRMLTAIDIDGSRAGIQSLTTTAEGTGPEGLFVTTVTSIPPDSLYFRQVSGTGSTEIWSTPENTWGGRAGEEYAALGPRVRDFVREQEYHLMLLDIRSRFSGFELQGSDTVDEKECLRVGMTGEAGEGASLCIGDEEWLPLELRLNPASGPVRIEFGDWRRLDGLNLFHSLERTEDADAVYSYEFVDISVNKFATEMRVPPPTLPRVQEDDE